MSFEDTNFDDAPSYQSTNGNSGNQGGNNWDSNQPREQQGQGNKPTYGSGNHYSSSQPNRPPQSQPQGQPQSGHQRNNDGGNQGSQGYQQRPYNGNSNGGQRQYNNSGNGAQSGYKGGFNKGGNSGGFPKREVDPNPQLYFPYAAFGSDNPPPHIIDQIQKTAKRLEMLGFTMRCGGMVGCEDIFEKATNKQEIHLPWRDFDKKQSKFTFTMDEAKILAGKFQPGFEGLKPVIQTFLAKNVRVLQGKDLKSPAIFMILWTEDGAENSRERSPRTGNAGHAVAVADAMRIPVFNLGRQGSFERLNDYIGNMESQQQSANN